MYGLPAIWTAPPAVLPPPDGASPSARTTLRTALDAGIPARIPLTGDLALMLSVGLGQARRYLDSDPSTPVVTMGDSAGSTDDAQTARDPDDPLPRLSVVRSGGLGDSVAVTPGVPLVLTFGGAAAVEVSVTSLIITAGSLRSPGQFGSALVVDWRSLGSAPDTGAPAVPGDSTIPRRPRRLLMTTYLRGREMV